jgi:hypothetical protein
MGRAVEEEYAVEVRPGDQEPEEEREDWGELLPGELEELRKGEPVGICRFRRRRRTSCWQVRNCRRWRDSAW